MHARIALALLVHNSASQPPAGTTAPFQPARHRSRLESRLGRSTPSESPRRTRNSWMEVRFSRSGETVDLTACAVYSDQTRKIARSRRRGRLSTTSIATVDQRYGDRGSTRRGGDSGPAYQTVSVTTAITVQAAAAVPERLLITGPEDFLENREIEVGQTVQLGADLEMSDGSVRENVDTQWTSSNTTVATVDSSGLVTARQAGGFDVRATAEGLTARLTGVSAVSANRSPTVTVSCDPCEVEVENEVRLRANASDPDDDPLSYSWSAPRGRFIGSTSGATARWRAPDQTGSVQISVRVTDGRGGSASRSVTVRVNRPAAPDHPPDTGVPKLYRDAGSRLEQGRESQWRDVQALMGRVPRSGPTTSTPRATATTTGMPARRSPRHAGIEPLPAFSRSWHWPASGVQSGSAAGFSKK